MVESDINLKYQSIPEHWSLFLRCTICFGYLEDPHTLECGHTFCKRCLKRLAEIAREDNPDVRVRRLTLSCPTCRHQFSAKPVLGDKVCTSIVLKHMVELWKRECKLLASSSTLMLRSICSQTGLETNVDSGEVKSSDDHEEFSVRMRPMDLYCEAVMKRVTESTDDIEPDLQDIIFQKSTLASGNVTSAQRGNTNISSDSDSSFASENDTSNTSSSLSNTSIPAVFGRVNIPRITFTECTPGRFLLMLVWCMYSVVIVGLAEAFLPYVILFTLFFFLVALR